MRKAFKFIPFNAAKRPKRVLTIPLAPPEATNISMAAPIIGMAAKFFAEDLEIWQLIIREDMAEEVALTLLAVLLVNDSETIIPPEFMPRYPPLIALLDNRIIRTQRGSLLPEWALKEVDRIVSVLRRNDPYYIADIVAE
jgi:hypothetical protein